MIIYYSTEQVETRVVQTLWRSEEDVEILSVLVVYVSFTITLANDYPPSTAIPDIAPTSDTMESMLFKVPVYHNHPPPHPPQQTIHNLF